MERLKLKAEEAKQAAIAATTAVQEAEEREAMREVTAIQHINTLKREAQQSTTSLQQTEELLSMNLTASTDLILGPKIITGHGTALYGASLRGCPYSIVAPKSEDMLHKLTMQETYFCRVRVENGSIATTRSGNWNAAMLARPDFLKHGSLDIIIEAPQHSSGHGHGGTDCEHAQESSKEDVKDWVCRLDDACTVGELKSMLALAEGLAVEHWDHQITFADPADKDTVASLDDNGTELASYGIKAGSVLSIVQTPPTPGPTPQRTGPLHDQEPLQSPPTPLLKAPSS